ncbi:MAG: M3 family oligoendopeptidase [Chloroflexia bacterium]
MPAIATARTQPHRFVPDEFDPTHAAAVTHLYGRLEERDISTCQALEDFILDWEELDAVITECYARSYVDMTSDTTNPDYKDLYLKVVQEVVPVAEQKGFDLKQKLLTSPALDQLGDEYEVFLRNMRAEVEIFREENVPLFTEERKLDQEFEEISGAQQAEFRGQVYPLPQLARFLEETDRATREEAWRVRAEARYTDAGALDALYDRMYEVRQQIAANAGFANYRDYQFKAMKRFDYTPEDCLAFHDAIEKHIVPVIVEDQERRKTLLGLDTLRPWDLNVDPDGKEPLRPFDSVDRLKAGCERIVLSIDPELGLFFRTMMDQHLLDLESRPGKSPGGYMMSFPDKRVPFIFMNAVGTKRDVDVVLHEGGHAFHYFLARELPLNSYHHASLEFSEVASMTMELLSRPYMSEFYAEEQLPRLMDEQLREALRFFPFMAMIDAFQHWAYTTPDHGPQVRRARWAELEQRFRPGVDWTGLEPYRDAGWQYPHVFSVPFYYVEYGIAQLAAFKVWLNSLKDEKEALRAYKRALALGGSRPLPDLFKAAGAEFGLNDRIVSAIIRDTVAQIGSRDQ